MDEKNNDFMNSAVLFGRSAETIKQKSPSHWRLEEHDGKISVSMTASVQFFHKYLLTKTGY